jgi:hypothetical protein
MTNQENARREHLYSEEPQFFHNNKYLTLSGKYTLTPSLDNRSFGSRAMVMKGVSNHDFQADFRC